MLHLGPPGRIVRRLQQVKIVEILALLRTWSDFSRNERIGENQTILAGGFASLAAIGVLHDVEGWHQP